MCPRHTWTGTRSGSKHEQHVPSHPPDGLGARCGTHVHHHARDRPTSQYAGDFIFSDWLVAQGYAYAMTDKGNNGGTFYRDGAEPDDALAEWHQRVTQLTKATKEVVRQRYGRAARRTYLFGITNGGYLTRWQLENRGGLYNGGVDWEGTLLKPEEPTLISYLPAALRNYPAYKAGSEAAHDAMIEAGFEPGSEFTWDFHYAHYWDVTQRLYREEFDPTWDGALEAGCRSVRAGRRAATPTTTTPAARQRRKRWRRWG